MNTSPLLSRSFPANLDQRRPVDIDLYEGEERRASRVIGFDGVDWTTELRLADAAVAQNERRFTGAALTEWSVL